ncbi:MAG: molybdopterin-dependent oxidoreductase, partial [Desulfobacteraceae bacterium]|nr:molybdopterin-dependent oxidoreductase [Desulfobacteraceae bacterium]
MLNDLTHGPISKVYKILSTCFRYPDRVLFDYARGDLFNDLEGSLMRLPYREMLRGGLELLHSALARMDSCPSLEDVQIAHTGLFIYARGERCCYPYESIYRGENRGLMGESTIAVKRAYRDFGLRVSRRFADLPDHIAAELEFMHFLTFNEEKFSSARQDQYRVICVANEISFLESHLQKWVPAFYGCIEENKDSLFFRALSRLTADFLNEETAYLKDRCKAHEWNDSLAVDEAHCAFDTSTLTVLEPDTAVSEPRIKWVFSTSPERYWTGIPCAPVRVKVIDGRETKIEARDDVPFFDGRQDVRSFACFSKLYAPDKLKFPLKRVGERGEGKFKRVSWDEALNEIAAVLKAYRDEGNARYVAFLRTHPPVEFMFNHFTHHYGSPNDIHTSTTSCYVDGEVAEALTGGSLSRDEYSTLRYTLSVLGNDDYLHSDYTLYIGHNLLSGIRDLPSASRFSDAIRRGMKFIFVDPRLNEGSYTYGAEWVPIKPGTDGAFILALMNVIIREKVYDEEFLLNQTNAPILIRPDGYPLKDRSGEYLVWDRSVGKVQPLEEALQPAILGDYEVALGGFQGSCRTAFQLLSKRVKPYTSERVAEITTIGKEKIEEIARNLGIKKPRVSIYSRKTVSAQYSNSMQYCRARNVLLCLLGIFDKPGGKYYGPYGTSGIELNKGSDFRIPIEIQPFTEDRVDFDPTVHSSVNTKREDFPNGVPQNVLRAIKTGNPYPIKSLFIIGSDVLASHSSEWREAFKKVDFIVKSHVWPDDDVDYADIVLPEAAYFERDDGFAPVSVHDPQNLDMEFTFLSVMQQVVQPQFEERPWTDYVKDLAQRIGFGECYDFTLDEYWNFLLKPMDIDIGYLRTHGVFYKTPLVTRKIEFGRKGRWNTDTGRLNIYSAELVDLWHKGNQNPLFDPLPIYHPIPVAPEAAEEFYLINGKCSYFNCNFYRDNAMLLERYLEGELGNTLLWINAKRAEGLGIKDRDWVWVE